jgi:phage shock protein E
MVRRGAWVLVVLLLGTVPCLAADGRDAKRRAARVAEANPAIDMAGFLAAAQEAAEHRETRRVSEREFLDLAARPGTIILDARSRERFDELHVKGAMNLDFSNLAVDSLNAAIPDRSTAILIYCNNNFTGLGSAQPFPAKLAPASLNLSTYVSLFTYGYRNVYELAPLIELDRSILPFEGTLATARTSERSLSR